MALTQTQLLTLVGVLAILFAVILYNNVVAARARRTGQPAASKSSGDGPAVHPMLAKFAHHDGSIVGEGVAIDGDRLILKQAGTFKAVPLATAAVKGDDVVLTGAIDWTAAIAAGTAWHAAHRGGHDDAVSGALTRSEDVKAPAIESVKERESR